MFGSPPDMGLPRPHFPAGSPAAVQLRTHTVQCDRCYIMQGNPCPSYWELADAFGRDGQAHVDPDRIATPVEGTMTMEALVASGGAR